MKIKYKISLTFLFAAITLIGIVLFIVFSITTSIMSDRINAHLRTTSQSRAHHIETYLEALKSKVVMLASDSLLENTLKRIINNRQIVSRDIEMANKELRDALETDKDLQEIFILDPKGIIIFSTDENNIGLDRSGDAYFLGGKEGAYIKDAYISQTTNKSLISLSVPLTDEEDGELLGVLVVRSSLSGINIIATDRSGLGRTGEIYLVNKYGYMITPSRFIKDTFLEQKVDTIAVERYLLKKDTEHIPMVDVYPDYRGVPVLGVYHYIMEMGWVLLAEIDEEEAFESLDKIRNFFILLFFIIPVIAYLIGSFVARFISGPIERLHKGTEIIGKGNLDHKVATDEQDEIGQLSRAFDSMTDNLKESTTSVGRLNMEIDERKKAENEIMRSQREWEDTFDIMVDAITIHDKDFNIIKANRAAMKILDLPILKNNNIKCYKYLHGTDDSPEGCPSSDCIKTGTPETIEMFEPHLNKYLEIRTMPRYDSKNQIIGVIHLVRDITEKKEMEDRLKAMSITDDLTGLYNRRGFFALIKQQLKIVKRGKEKAFMLYVDIDNFKEINDTLGHSTGDSVLIDVGNILKSTYRESDIVARIGGDEFVVFPAVKEESDIRMVTDRLQSNIDAYNLMEKRVYKLSMSVGIASYDPEDPCPIDDVLAEADRSMYENKRQKKKT